MKKLFTVLLITSSITPVMAAQEHIVDDRAFNSNGKSNMSFIDADELFSPCVSSSPDPREVEARLVIAEDSMKEPFLRVTDANLVFLASDNEAYKKRAMNVLMAIASDSTIEFETRKDAAENILSLETGDEEKAAAFNVLYSLGEDSTASLWDRYHAITNALLSHGYEKESSSLIEKFLDIKKKVNPLLEDIARNASEDLGLKQSALTTLLGNSEDDVVNRQCSQDLFTLLEKPELGSEQRLNVSETILKNSKDNVIKEQVILFNLAMGEDVNEIRPWRTEALENVIKYFSSEIDKNRAIQGLLSIVEDSERYHGSDRVITAMKLFEHDRSKEEQIKQILISICENPHKKDGSHFWGAKGLLNFKMNKESRAYFISWLGSEDEEFRERTAFFIATQDVLSEDDPYYQTACTIYDYLEQAGKYEILKAW